MSLGSTGECYWTKSRCECPWAAQGEISPCAPPLVCKEFSIPMPPSVPTRLQHIIMFLEALHNTVVQDGPEQTRFVVIWDNVSFHQAALVRDWLTNHNNFTVVQDGPEQPRFVVIWDNVSFHQAALVRDWFTTHNNFTVVQDGPEQPRFVVIWDNDILHNSPILRAY